MGPIIVAFLFVGFIAGESDFHSQLSPEDLQSYFGVQVRENVPTYEIVSPVHVKGSRHRRSLLAAKEPLRFDLAAFGEDFKLHLDHNDDLIAPGCLVHYLQSNGTKKVRPCPTHEEDCYYHGTSLTHNGSEASLSTCNGLHGLIRLPGRDYDLWIQPVQEHHVERARRSTSNTLNHPHIVSKRAVADRQCATQGVPEVNSLVSEATSAARVRRAAGDKYAEMLLVGDRTMQEHYKDKLKQYLLTVANVAARVLLDPSIGTPLHFTVVKIQILEADQPGLVITENAEDTLESFCEWQEQYNPRDDNNPQHHDGASLFTRLDIVHAGVRDTTGYATVSGMCGVKSRCSVNEDNGLGVGLTLAHETGHTLGMLHDGAGNNCENGKNVMSSMGGGGRTAMFWSSCSRQSYSDFLATTKAECLNDRPQTSVALPKDLPGVVYDGDEQCEMYIGAGSTICLGTNMVHGDECSHLVCFDPQQTGTCKGDSVPRLDGTMCGDRKYCMHGQCVDIGPNGPQPRNGGWSAWDSEWSSCSRSCGGGVRVRRRKCDNPKPRLGGRDCQGSDVMAEMCNMQDCRSSEEEFRKAQCAMTDSIPMNGQRHHWVPVNMLGEQECELHCRIDGQRTVLLRHINGKSWYQDGTVCASVSGSFGRCIDGKCRDFGCDGKTGSRYQFDRCGVCGGQGNTCRKQSGTYNQGRKNEYVTFVTMPKGSTAIKITNANKFTQMSVKIAGKRVFSQDGGTADQSGMYTADSIVINYKSPSSGLETISISGPLPESVEAQVFRKFADNEFQGVAPQISYEYFVPTAAHPQSNYQWKARNGACTKTCGGGVYNRVITCTRRGSGAQVDEHFCDLRQKPAMYGSACNNQACPPRWRAGSFGQCSKTCGGGQQTRAVDCVQDRGGVEEVVAARNCPANRRPSATRRCNAVACPAVWQAGDWSACSLTCGKGVRTRAVKCVKDDSSRQEVAESQCPAGSKPEAMEACVTAVCSPEITGAACKDTDQTCASYGLTMCQDYASFARQSCMKHCSFCTPDGSVGAVCANKNADCEGYGQSICTGEYADWARSSCAKLCGYCSVGGGGGTSGTCADKSGDCEGYGQSICTGEYSDWAKDNCAKFCGHCGTTTTTTTTNNNNNNNNAGGSGGNGGSTACEDKSGDCAGYGQSICTGQYAAWATDNCAKYCGHCGSGGGGGTTSGAACEDKSGDCVGYGQSICTGQYAAWATDNCAKYCGHCGSGGGGGATSGAGAMTTAVTPSQMTATTTLSKTTTTTTTSSTTTPQPATVAPTATASATTAWSTTQTAVNTATPSSSCRDTENNCAAFGKSFCTDSNYTTWAKANCAHYCNFCESQGSSAEATTPAAISTTMTPAVTTPKPKLSTIALVSGCADAVSNCQQYGKDFCSQPAYAAWARENCARHCNICPGEHSARTTTAAATSTTPKLKLSTAVTTTTTAITTTTMPKPKFTAALSSICKDALSNCQRYGTDFCSQPRYTAWAKENCARHCNLCQDAQTTTAAATTSPKPKPSTTVTATAFTAILPSSCNDALSNCQQYGTDFCFQPAYTAWAKENCARYCSFCQDGHSTSTTAIVATATTTAPKTTSTKAFTTIVAAASCFDAVKNCEQYGFSFCSQAAYVDWARENCARHCKFCPVRSMPGAEACEDKLATCAQYGQDTCKKSDFQEWAALNCAKFCGVCEQQETIKSTSLAMQTMTVTTTTPSSVTVAARTAAMPVASTASSSSCRDAINNCEAYGLSFCTDEHYADFAKDNCAHHCHFCRGSTPAEEECKDKLDNCLVYSQDVCQSPDYKEWAHINCAKFCGFCSKEGTASAQGTSATMTTTKQSIADTTKMPDDSCHDVADNCAELGATICTGPYAEWALQNCRLFCRQCGRGGKSGGATPSPGNGSGTVSGGNGNGNNGQSGTGTPTNSGSGNGNGNSGQSGTGTPTGSDSAACSDKADNCAAYGQSVCSGTYAAWAGDNCQKFCGLCSSSAAASSATGHGASNCVDTSSDCQAYGASVCNSYADWAAANCQKFCNKCGSRRRRSVLLPPPLRPLCNNVLTDPVGSLALIGQPVDSSCTQIIVAPLGSRIQLSFTALHISCEEGDWLEVKEEGGKAKGEKERRDLCDQAAPVQWTTTGNVVTIMLSAATAGHGYNLTYRMEKSPQTGNTCDRLLTNPSGALASPGFPAPYTSDKLCLTTIIAPPSFSVRLDFSLFHLDSQDCGKDSVTVYDEEFGTKDVFCGMWSDLTWQSKGNRVKVIFASNQKGGPGFLASYRFVAPW